MQADKTVLSLRPGGGSRGGSRVFGPRFEAAAANFDIPVLRPRGGGGAPSLKTGESRFEGRERFCYTRDQLLQLREVVNISEEILKVKQEVEAEFSGIDPSWGHGESNVPNQAQGCYSETDNRDWRNRSAQFPVPREERSWEAIRDRDFGGQFDSRQPEVNQYNRQEQLSSQFARLQNEGGGPNPALIMAEVPWSARRGHLSEEERVLKTVKGILNKPTPEEFDLLKGQWIDSGITLNKLTPVLSPPAKACSSKPSDEGTLPLLRIDPPCVDPDEVPTNLPVLGAVLSDKGKFPQAVQSTSDVPQFSKAADEDADAVLRSIQDVFISWEQLKASAASRSSSANRPSASSIAFSEENMVILKQSVLEYVSFMDMDILNASASKQRDKFELLSAKMAQTLELPSLKISLDLKLTLKIIHSEISSLLAKNVELKAKKTQHLRAANEKESLLQEIEKVKSELNEISSEVVVEDSLMVSLVAEMKELQARMDKCKARLAAKKRTASQGVERSKSLLKCYSKLDVDEEVMTELSTAAQEQHDDWEKLREQMHSLWARL